MPRMILDFGDVNYGGFEPIPKGTYSFEITTEKADEVRVGAGKGTEYITLTFNVLDGEYENRKIFENFMLSGKGMFKLGNLLNAIGLLDESNKNNFRFDAMDLEGKKVRGVVILTEYEGVQRNEIKTFLPYDAVAAGADSAPARRPRKV